MQWHYDEAEAGRVGHPWKGDPLWMTGTECVSEAGWMVLLGIVGIIICMAMAVEVVAIVPIWAWKKWKGDV